MRTVVVIIGVLLVGMAAYIGAGKIFTEDSSSKSVNSVEYGLSSESEISRMFDSPEGEPKFFVKEAQLNNQMEVDSDVGEELKEINTKVIEAEEGDQLSSSESSEKTDLQKKVDGIVASERRKFFGDLVRDLRDKLDTQVLGIALLELREILEQNLETRQRIRKMLDEIMELHSDPNDEFFEKVARYRRERMEFFKTLSLQLRTSLQERNLSEEQVSTVINSLEKRLEKQRIIF